MGNRYGLHTSVEVDELHREPREVYQCYMRFLKPKSYSASGCNGTPFFGGETNPVSRRVSFGIPSAQLLYPGASENSWESFFSGEN